jgi:hypothetical protein
MFELGVHISALLSAENYTQAEQLRLRIQREVHAILDQHCDITTQDFKCPFTNHC